jgi:hypothetical protein
VLTSPRLLKKFDTPVSMGSGVTYLYVFATGSNTLSSTTSLNSNIALLKGSSGSFLELPVVLQLDNKNTKTIEDKIEYLGEN